MQASNELAENLLNVFNPREYTEFQRGDFANQPDLEGIYYIFKKLKDPKFCLIINTSSRKYPSNMVKIKDYVFIVLNISNLDEYFANLGEKYFPIILEVVDENMQKENERNLPYGYYTDENGDLKVDIKKAGEVRKIYNSYIEVQSVRKIAEDMKTNFSFIRDILHDAELYKQMQPKILTNTVIEKVIELMAENVKGGAIRKETTEDKIKAVRDRRERTEAQRAEIEAKRAERSQV